MGQPAARLTDMHTCPMVTGVVPHVGGPIVAPGAPTVLIGDLPAARVTDECICVGPPDIIVMGAFTVLISGLPAARLGDMTAHGGVIVLGDFTVLIGDAGDSDPDDDDDDDDEDEPPEETEPDQEEDDEESYDQDASDDETQQPADNSQQTEELHATQYKLDGTAATPEEQAGSDLGNAAGNPAGDAPASAVGDAQTPVYQGNAQYDEGPPGAGADAGAGDAVGQSTTGDVYGQIVSGGTGSAPSDPFAIDNTPGTVSAPTDGLGTQGSAPFQLSASEAGPGAGGLASRSASGDVFGQVVRGGTGAAPSAPFSLGATQNTYPAAPPGGPSVGPFSGAPNIPLLPRTPVMDTSAPTPAPTPTPTPGGAFALNANQDLLKSGVQQNQFNLGAQKAGPGPGSPPPVGGAPSAPAANPPTPTPPTRLLTGGVTGGHTIVNLPDGTKVDSFTPQSEDERQYRAGSGFLAGASSGSSDEAKETNKAIPGRAELSGIDQNQEQREANKKLEGKVEQSKQEEADKVAEKQRDLLGVPNVGKASEVLEMGGDAADRVGLGAVRPEAPTSLRGALDTAEKESTGIPIIDKTLEARQPKPGLFGKAETETPNVFGFKTTAQDALEKSGEAARESAAKGALEKAAPIAGTIQELTSKETREEVDSWLKFLDKHDRDVEQGLAPDDPFIRGYANGRLTWLTGKSYRELFGLGNIPL